MGLFGPTSLLAYTNAPVPTVKVTTSAPNIRPSVMPSLLVFLVAATAFVLVIYATGYFKLVSIQCDFTGCYVYCFAVVIFDLIVFYNRRQFLSLHR